MLKSDDDHVALGIRPGYWQQFLFPDSASREPFRDVMDPLLKWLDVVNKRKAKELSEEAGRNNCLPPSKTEFAQRNPAQPSSPQRKQSVTSAAPPANAPAPPHATYTLQMFDDRMVNYRPEVTCLLVSASGAYHLVKQSKNYHKSLSSAVLDGTLAPPQLASLRAILDAPDLVNQPEENQDVEVVMTRDSYLTHLAIPRGGTVQKIAAWKSYRILNQTMSSSVEDHGTKLLAPLRQWLKINIAEKSAVPTPIPPNPRCLPGG